MDRSHGYCWGVIIGPMRTLAVCRTISTPSKLETVRCTQDDEPYKALGQAHRGPARALANKAL